MKKTELLWVAGLLEGEGCFSFGVRKEKLKTTKYPHVQCRMCDKDVLVKLAHIVGGQVHGPYKSTNTKHRPAYSWGLYRWNDVLSLIAKLLPHMGERRQTRMRYVLDYCKYSVCLARKQRYKRSDKLR